MNWASDALGSRILGNLVTIQWMSERWRCSADACHRFLRDHGAVPIRICPDAQHSALAFRLSAVLLLERGAGGCPEELEVVL